MHRGVVIAATAYVVWGLSPIYWRLIDELPAGDIVIHRIVATALFLGAIQLGGRTFARLWSHVADRRGRWMLLLSASLLSTNWVVFVWAVNSERVLEASLGYFINPLVSVVLAVVVLGERLRRAPMVSVGIATIGVIILAVDVGRPPWVSLILAGTFGLYGLVRKTSPIESLDGLTLELFVLAPVALALLAVRAATGDGLVGASVPGRDLLLLGAGVVTATPLLLFAHAARRIELWLIGLLQFIAPTIQFILGVVVWNEEWSGGQVVGFVVIWGALVIFALDPLFRARRSPGSRLAVG